MSTNARVARARNIANKIEAQAKAIPCVRGVPVDPIRRRTLSKRYRVVLDIIMAHAREHYQHGIVGETE